MAVNNLKIILPIMKPTKQALSPVCTSPASARPVIGT